MDEPAPKRRTLALWGALTVLFGHWPLTLHRWFRERLWRGDALWMVLLSAFTLLTTAEVGQGTGVMGILVRIPQWVVLLWGVAFTLPLLWRRTHPLWAAVAFVPPHIVQLVLVDSVIPANIVVPMVVYAAARYDTARRSRIVLAIALVGSLAAGIDWGLGFAYATDNSWGARIGRIVANTIPCLAIVLACWFWGQWSRQRAVNLQTLKDRTEALEREREQGIKLVAQEERNRLAREMHDIVAHSLSVIVVQADGAGYLAGHSELGDAEARLAQVTKAIETIGTTARTALGETRRLVGVLRDDTQDAMELAPAATLDQIGALVAQVQTAGVPARFTEVGEPTSHPALPAGAEMAAYRVVQESLTNVLKHAGAGATVQVRLTHAADGITITVADTGRGTTDTDGLGHGVIGMRERVTVWGGTLVARPRSQGGFEVLAHIPATPDTKDIR